MNLPPHIALTIEHNDHRLNYETVEMYLLNRGDQGPDFENEQAKQAAISMNELWEMIWFPRTPVGSIHIAAPTLESLLKFALSIE